MSLILQHEISQLKEEIAGKNVGTTHVCEAFVMLLCYVNFDWVIKQKVCRMILLAKYVTGEGVARQLITVLPTKLSIAQHLVVSSLCDCATVNDVAMITMKVLYNDVIDIG